MLISWIDLDHFDHWNRSFRNFTNVHSIKFYKFSSVEELLVNLKRQTHSSNFVHVYYLFNRRLRDLCLAVVFWSWTFKHIPQIIFVFIICPIAGNDFAPFYMKNEKHKRYKMRMLQTAIEVARDSLRTHRTIHFSAQYVYSSQLCANWKFFLNIRSSC